jgi:ribonuclease J
METKLSYFGGKNEIGGNKILIEHKNTRIFLDFGMSFDNYKQYFAEFLQPRKCNALFDFFEFGLLPKLNGIYRKDYCLHCGLKYPEKPFVNAVLLSHAHIDHSAYLHFLREDIPIYCTEETFLILQALEETSTASFMELVNLKRSFHFVKTKKETYKRLEGEEAKVPRNFVIVEPYKKYQINGVEIQAIPVDHSLPGACAFVIYTDSGNVVYTGDFRFHGRRGKLTRKFVEIARDANPEIMLCEGTRIDETSNVTEEEVENKSKEVIVNSKGLVVVNYPIRDLDRLLTFFNVAKDTDKELVVNLKQAFLLKLFEKVGNYPKLKNVVMYIDRKGWGLISDEFYVFLDDMGWIKGNEVEEKEIKRDYYKWEREFLDLDNIATYKEVRENPSNFIFRCDNFELNELIDIKPKDGVYIRSLTEPFSEDMIIEERRVENWLIHFNLLPIHQIHASGHANGLEIKEMIEGVKPKQLIPVHTKHPEYF